MQRIYKGFYRYVNQKRRIKESVPLVMSKNGNLVSTDEKAEVLNNFFASVSTGSLSPHPLESMDHKVETRGVKPLPL